MNGFVCSLTCKYLTEVEQEGYDFFYIGYKEWIITRTPLGIAGFVVSVATPILEVTEGLIVTSRNLLNYSCFLIC